MNYKVPVMVFDVEALKKEREEAEEVPSKPPSRGTPPKHRGRGDRNSKWTHSSHQNSEAFQISKGFSARHRTTTIHNLDSLKDKVHVERTTTNRKHIDKELESIVPDTGFSKSRTTPYSFTADLYWKLEHQRDDFLPNEHGLRER